MTLQEVTLCAFRQNKQDACTNKFVKLTKTGWVMIKVKDLQPRADTQQPQKIHIFITQNSHRLVPEHRLLSPPEALRAPVSGSLDLPLRLSVAVEFAHQHRQSTGDAGTTGQQAGCPPVGLGSLEKLLHAQHGGTTGGGGG